ncbi:MAG: DUF4857 domain-containing protein [Sulfurovum sp.]|nr:DUF4857 domain-containing protein [Sulfurovum sp.]
MINSIIKKEWLKIKLYFFVAIILIIGSLAHFVFNLNFSFSTIEPESMMWYQFAHIQDKPYFYLSYLFLIVATVVSLSQFLPEKIQNRIKIMAHLPLKMRSSLFRHLIVGIGFIMIICLILGMSIILIFAQHYPSAIVEIAVKDMLWYSFASIVLYLGLSAVIIEKNPVMAIFKLILVLLFIASFVKERFWSADIVWIIFLVYMPFLALDSFYSIKQQRLNSIYYKIGTLATVAVLFYGGYKNYTENYQKEFERYYIFYSNVAKDFVYQKNFGDHQFEHGIQGKGTFDRLKYESYLPFVYWRNLDIQKKLPIVVNGKKFDKATIKKSRLGFSYNPKHLQKLEVEFYPLLNPHSDIGMIKFPEEMFEIAASGAAIYDYDNGLSIKLTDEMNQQLTSSDFVFPATHIWGKPTNMKPYDKGYLVLDSNKALFNIKRKDDKIYVTKVHYPEGIDLAYIKISENKQKELSGYAIDTNSNFYFLSWDFVFEKIKLPKFDYRIMKLKLISNPLNYVIRYDDGQTYYAVYIPRDGGKHKHVKFVY